MCVVTMRTDCRHYQSRTYGTGEAVRKCTLDLAPEAPWRCPADCAKYERKMIDAGWQYGSLTPTRAPVEPPEAETDPTSPRSSTTPRTSSTRSASSSSPKKTARRSASSSARKSASANPNTSEPA